MLKGGSQGWSSDQLSVSSALSFWYLHPQPLAGPQASAPVGALPTAEGIPSCTAPGYPRVSLLLLNIVPVAFAVASVDLISLSEGTLCSVLPLSQTLDHIFFPPAQTPKLSLRLATPVLSVVLHRVALDTRERQISPPRRQDQHQHSQLRRRPPGWFPVPVSVIRHFILGRFSVEVCDTQRTPSIPTSLT